VRATSLEQELATLPDEYTGETYRRLRLAASGLRIVNDTMDGDLVDVIADAYGRAIYTKYYVQLMSPPTDGGADADDGSTDGAPPDASPGDAAPSDAGDAEASVPVPDGILGRRQGSEVAYSPADVATAALALLDMAVRKPMDANQVGWQVAADRKSVV
jgi:hypothetical protein